MTVDLDAFADDAFCYLTTTGRRTGRPHTIEIWFAVHDGRLCLLAGGGDRADWVQNLRVTPQVTVRLGEREGPATATVVEPDDPLQPQARRLLAGKYQGWREGAPLSDWAIEALLVAVDPAG